MHRWKEPVMNRICLSMALALAILSVASARATDLGVLDAEVMKIALHTSTEQEGGFIEYVVTRVQNGTLPLDLVQSTFLWAKNKPVNKFFYFRQGLILRAANLGIRL